VAFQVGDKVIYPNHGLGVVEKVEEKTILGTTCGFFHLRILSNDTTVLVPVANVDNVGLRRAIDDDEVERLFGKLGDGKIDNHTNWKGRFKDNSDKMRSGSIADMADVLKSLTFLAKSKSLSFREKRMLDRAKSLIVSEVSEVMNVTALAIEERVEKALERCFTTKARNAQRAETRAETRKAAPAPVKAAPAPVKTAPVAVKTVPVTVKTAAVAVKAAPVKASAPRPVAAAKARQARAS
jgi:CarD family transcriptional regulator